jgi:triosephosphate isomerase (TIM)
MRKPVIAGNWKMFKTVKETVQFIEQVKPLVQNNREVEVVIAPPYTALSDAVKTSGGSNVKISSQSVHWEKEGAFTGEIAAGMLVELGVQYCIIGHSERRQYFGETNQTVFKRTKAALQSGLIPIVCVGEVLEEREAGRTAEVIKTQFSEGLAGLTPEEFSHIIIAYEPVWAIGTGKTATPEMAEEVHRQIRGLVKTQYGEQLAEGLRVLYGGSVKPDNVKGLMSQPDIDGALVGGASLKPDSFAALVNY